MAALVILLLVAVATGLLARPAEASKRPFAGIVDSAARRHGVDPELVHAVIAVESSTSRRTARSIFPVTGAVTRLATAGRLLPRRQLKNALQYALLGRAGGRLAFCATLY